MVQIIHDPPFSFVGQSDADARFHEFKWAVTHWIDKLGLKDWYVAIEHNSDPTDANGAEALIEYDRNTRHATVTYYSACEKPQPTYRVACHEVLHLLFADTIPEDCGDDVAREEHRVIERLLHALL